MRSKRNELTLVAFFILLGIAAVFAFLVFQVQGSQLITPNKIVVRAWSVHSGALPTTPNCTAANSAYMTLVLDNSDSNLNITQIAAGTSTVTIGKTFYLVGNTCTMLSTDHQPIIKGEGATTTVTLFLGGGSSTVSGLESDQSLSYNIYFSNGEDFGGSTVVQ